MPSTNAFPFSDIKAVFADEVESIGGSVTDTTEHGEFLFARSVLPWVADVCSEDTIKGGVAVKAEGPSIWILPYVLRLVCTNGLVRPLAIETRHLMTRDLEVEETGRRLREAVQGCCAKEVFTSSTEEMRNARGVRVGLRLDDFRRFFSGLPARRGNPSLREIVHRFSLEADESAFGLVNVVTATARETRDPQLRWHLEEIGGRILASAGRGLLLTVQKDVPREEEVEPLAAG